VKKPTVPVLPTNRASSIRNENSGIPATKISSHMRKSISFAGENRNTESKQLLMNEWKWRQPNMH
jgi:hypothetical protein